VWHIIAKVNFPRNEIQLKKMRFSIKNKNKFQFSKHTHTYVRKHKRLNTLQQTKNIEITFPRFNGICRLNGTYLTLSTDFPSIFRLNDI